MTNAPTQRLTGLAALMALAAVLTWAPVAALTASAAAVAAMAVAASPALALACVAFTIPLGSLAPLSLGDGALTATPILLAIAAAGRLSDGLLWRRSWHVDRWLVAPLAIFVGALAVSAWRAPDVMGACFEVARWLELGLALVLAAGLAGRTRSVRWVLLAILAAGSVEALIGTRQALAGAGPIAFAVAPGRYRAFGDFGQPNPFGGYMNMVWPLGVALLVPWMASRRSPARPEAILRVAGAVAATLAGVGLVLSWSRGAWLAAAVAALVMGGVWLLAALWPPVRPRALALVVGLALIGLSGLALGGIERLPNAVAGRLDTISSTFAVWDVADAEVNDTNFATIERVAHWQAAAAMWAAKPWLGQGPGEYAAVYPQYRLPRWADALGHAHNYYLQVLAESGLIGLVGYLVFFGAAVVMALRAALWPRTPLQAAVGLGVVGVLAALAFHNLTDVLYVHELPAQVGLLLGLTVAAGGRA